MQNQLMFLWNNVTGHECFENIYKEENDKYFEKEKEKKRRGKKEEEKKENIKLNNNDKY